MKITYRTKLEFESPEDEAAVREILVLQREAVNACSPIARELERLSIVDLHARFYKDFRESQAKTPSQVVITAERECLARYKSAKSNKHRLSKAMNKKGLSIQLDKRLYSLKKDGSISITTTGKRVVCKPFLYQRLTEYWGRYKISDPLIFERNGVINIALIFDLPEMLPTEKKAVGIDLGIRNFAVTSDGEILDDKHFKKKKRELRFLKRKLQSCGSKSARKHLKRIRRKERNLNNDFVHRTSKKLILETSASVLVLENLKRIKRKKGYENKNSIGQVPLYEFRRVLTYKAPLYGKMVEVVDPRYTSQVDSRTGKMSGERKGRRYIASDGIVLDADWNAAINIARRSQHPVSSVVPFDGATRPFGQGVVTRPNVCKSSVGASPR